MLRLLHHARSFATKKTSSRLTGATRSSQPFEPAPAQQKAASTPRGVSQELSECGHKPEPGPDSAKASADSVASSRYYQQRQRGWRPWLADILWTIRYMTAIGILGHLFLSNAYSISGPFGASMLPTMRVEGEWVILKRWHRRGRGCKVGDLVTFDHPILSADGVGALKRIIGMPGDFVLCETPTHSDKMIQVPAGHCFVAGDNQLHSRDSRHFGPLPLALINAKVTARILPWSRRGWFKGSLEPV